MRRLRGASPARAIHPGAISRVALTRPFDGGHHRRPQPFPAFWRQSSPNLKDQSDGALTLCSVSASAALLHRTRQG
jgi:hypothetical protein